MPEFRVVCYEAGEWNQATAHVVEGQDEKAAAERVCGGPGRCDRLIDLLKQIHGGGQQATTGPG